jgi:hypothetical protein
MVFHYRRKSANAIHAKNQPGDLPLLVSRQPMVSGRSWPIVGFRNGPQSTIADAKDSHFQNQAANSHISDDKSVRLQAGLLRKTELRNVGASQTNGHGLSSNDKALSPNGTLAVPPSINSFSRSVQHSQAALLCVPQCLNSGHLGRLTRVELRPRQL